MGTWEPGSSSQTPGRSVHSIWAGRGQAVLRASGGGQPPLCLIFAHSKEGPGVHILAFPVGEFFPPHAFLLFLYTPQLQLGSPDGGTVAWLGEVESQECPLPSTNVGRSDEMKQGGTGVEGTGRQTESLPVPPGRTWSCWVWQEVVHQFVGRIWPLLVLEAEQRQEQMSLPQDFIGPGGHSSSRALAL